MLSRNRLQSAYAAPDFDASARLNAELPALEKTRRELEQIRTVAQDRGAIDAVIEHVEREPMFQNLFREHCGIGLRHQLRISSERGTGPASAPRRSTMM